MAAPRPLASSGHPCPPAGSEVREKGYRPRLPTLCRLGRWLVLVRKTRWWMDTLSHALWGGGLFGYRRRRRYFWVAIFFGAFPDLFSFGAWFIIRIAKGEFVLGKPTLNTIPAWVFSNYNLSHSFVVCFVIISMVAVKRRDLAFVMLGWPFHILLDFPFHSRQFFPTKIFWPLSDFCVDGIPWSNRWIWFPNVVGLILLYVWRARSLRGNVKKND